MHARQPSADRLDLGPRAAHLVHVRRRPADVADHAFELGIGGHLADFGQHRLLAAALDDAPFVGRDRAERAAAETAAHDLHAVFDHLERGNLFVAVAGVRLARVGQAVDAVHLDLRQRKRRRVDDDRLGAVVLHEPPRVVRVRFVVRDPRHVAEGQRIARDGVEVGQQDGVGASR